MTKLNAKQESFIKLMAESEELARHGFTVLLKHENFASFFDALEEAGLLKPERNPGPEPGEKEGYFRIPFWSALDYLTAVAKLSGERHDAALAAKVMTVVRKVSTWRDSEGKHRENYHTWRTFAGVLDLVPLASISLDDLDLIAIWLTDRFDASLVVRALDKGALSRFLSSSSAEDLDKAIVVLRHCVAIRWLHRKEFPEDNARPVPVAGDFWLKELIGHHAKTLGAKVGQKAATVFREKVLEVFNSPNRKLASRFYRAAIEDHAQNHDLNEAENRLIEGLRDVLLSWSEQDPKSAESFVEELLRDQLSILRRVGIYVLGRRWADMNALYSKVLTQDLFDPDHLHELYNLLRDHFQELDEKGKAQTIEAIRLIPLPSGAENPERTLKRIQQRWLSAIVDKGYPPTDKWFAELKDGAYGGPISDHPDFDAYFQVTSGPGPSPYSIQELVGFASEGIIVEKLMSFEQKDLWRGPSLEGLLSVLESAVRNSPESFLRILPQFLKAKRRFQYSVIWGLKQAWEVPGSLQNQVDWSVGWENVITFFEQLIGDSDFWAEKVPEHTDFDPTRDWVAGAIAEFLDAGTRTDERSFSSNLLPRTWALIKILLANAKTSNERPSDAMSYALNSPKGKAIQLLYSQSLRVCRTADRAHGSHEDSWQEMSGVFDAELSKCHNSNYEFSTFAGVYLAQLDYMNREWTKTNIDRIFPSDSPDNSICALEGLAYAPFTIPIYTLLEGNAILDRGLRYELKSEGPREKLIDRIAAAYLWGKEDLDSPRFSFLFSSGTEDDLKVVTRLLWTVRGQELTEDQRQRIIKYWERCVAWSHSKGSPPKELLSALSTLSCYLTNADGAARDLLEAVAPYVRVGYNTDIFVEELGRLIEVSPEGVSVVLGKLAAAYVPDYDYEDRLKSLLLRLAEKGRKQDAILYANQFRELPGMKEIFDRLTQSQ